MRTPGSGRRLVLVPERRTGVVVLANSNTVPTWTIAAAALDIALADAAPSVISGATPEELGEGVAAMRALLPPVVGPVAETLATSGPDAAAAAFHRLAAAEPAEFDLDDEGFEDAVWGAIELHRTSLVWPLLRLWTDAASGLLRCLDDDRLGPPGRRAARPGEESPPTRPRPRPRERRRRADHERPPDDLRSCRDGRANRACGGVVARG